MGSSEDPSLVNNVDELGLVYWLTLNLPKTTIVAQPFNVIKWQLKYVKRCRSLQSKLSWVLSPYEHNKTEHKTHTIWCFVVCFIAFWCRIHLWFRLMGGLQAKSMTSQRYPAVTRWRICVTMATLWQQQDGGYALLWERIGNNKMAAMRYYSTSSTVQS